MLPIPMETASSMRALYFVIIILDCTVMYIIFIIILFILWWFIYFILAFRTHVSSCVRGGIVTPNPD
jgi:hypothetical protein